MPIRVTIQEQGSNVQGTPLEVLARIAPGEQDVVLLHSADGEGGQAGVEPGVSVLGWDVLCKVTVDADGRAHLTGDLAEVLEGAEGVGGGVAGTGGALEVLERVLNAIEPAPGAAHKPVVGWMGFISYDIGATLERVPRLAPRELAWPLLTFTLFRRYIVWEPGAQGTRLRSITLAPEGHDVSDRAWPTSPPPKDPGAGRLVEQQPRADFLQKVRQVQEYIAAGDIYQANLAQRWVVETAVDPVTIYRRLCEASAAPFAAFIRFSDVCAAAGGRKSVTRHVLSASPELFLSLHQGHVITRPIKGTRPRDRADAARDASLRQELLASEKDQAELAMIVDLLRNDLGRVARFGSVKVTVPRAIEQHPTVWHTVATIEAELRADACLADLLAAVCPGGSITGAPKIRAMQIIEQLEGFRRELYCGTIGVISLTHAEGKASAVCRGQGRSMVLNIAIRTILMQAGKAYLYAGGGIVADSDPTREYEETLHKAGAMMRALGLAHPGDPGSQL